jgi:hypothetical protein
VPDVDPPARMEVRLRMTTEDRRRLAETAATLGLRPNTLMAMLLVGGLERLEGRTEDPAVIEALRALDATQNPQQLP